MCLVGRDKTKKDTYMLSCLLDMLESGEIRSDHKLQRKPDQIDVEERDGLIASMIKGEDIDPIKVCEQIFDDIVENWLIDGLQRLTTALKYKMGAFKLGKNVEFPIVSYLKAKKVEGEFVCDEEGHREYEVVEYDLREKGYEDLPPELKAKFDNYAFDMVKQLNCTDEEVGYHIRRYNRQKKMTGAQKTITYLDRTAGDIRKLSSHRFFKDCTNYKASEKLNGTVDKVVAESIMAINYLDTWKRAAKQQGMHIDKNCTKEEFNNIEEILDRLEKCLSEDNYELFTSKNSFLLIALFDKFKKLNIDDSKFDEFLFALKDSLGNKVIDGNTFNDLDEKRSSKDKGIVTAKLHILEILIKDFLNVDIQKMEKENTDYMTQEDAAESIVKEEVPVLDFVRENVKPDIDEDDLDLYYEMLYRGYDIDVGSKLLTYENEPSLIAMVAYSIEQDIEIDDWMKDFFNRNSDYIIDQKENYLHMKQDLENYLLTLEA